MVTGSVPWNRIYLSFLPLVYTCNRWSVCRFPHLFRYFLKIKSLVFSKFWNSVRNSYEVVYSSQKRKKKNLLKKLANGQKMSKEFLYYFLCKCLILGKSETWRKMDSCQSHLSYFLNHNSLSCWYKLIKIKTLLKIYWPAMVKNGCGHSCQEILKLAVSQKWVME